MTVLAAMPGTNGEMIAAVHELGRGAGWWPDDAVVLDPTYGRGKWWTDYRPEGLITHDIKTDGVDFRKLPEATGSIDVVAFDPPYVTPGGRKTTTLPDFQERYGIDAVPTTIQETHDLITDGLWEMRRVLTPGSKTKPRKKPGVGLVKAMNYTSGGKYRRAAYDILDEAESMGFTLIDEIVHLTGTGPQPPHARQCHARRNYSMLFVLQRDTTPYYEYSSSQSEDESGEAV